MDPDDKEELNALVVGFLTSFLNSNPHGFELRQFEKLFPEKTEEPDDWYKRYGVSRPIDALKQLGGAIRIHSQSGTYYVSLNTRSDKVDQHLVGLVVNQRSSGKRKSRPIRSQTQRVLDSFAINRRSSGFGNYDKSKDRYKSRLNHDNTYQRSQNAYVEKSVSNLSVPRPTIYKDQVRSAAPGDPRARHSSSQVRPAPPTQPFASGPPPTKQSAYNSYSGPVVHSRRPTIQLGPSPPAAPAQSKSSSTALKQPTVPAAFREPTRPSHATPISSSATRTVDPVLESRRAKIQQRLLYLLMHKMPEIKAMYLPYLYQKEFQEPLDPAPLGYKSLTELYLSFRDVIKMSYKSSTPTLSVVVGSSRGKENIANLDGNIRQNSRYPDNVHANSNLNNSFSQCDATDDKENTMSLGKARYNAIDPFNITTMIQSLEPLKNITEPPLGNNKLEDSIKYRTLRIMFKDPQKTLKLEDWERRYQQEWNCNNRIPLREYGFRSLLEFFKSLTKEMPFKIKLENDEWIAICMDFEVLSSWLKEQVAAGNYRAVIVIDAKYEHIAFPGDKYSYLDFEGLLKQPYYSSIKSAVKSAYKMCLQTGAGILERPEDSITFETSSSCYDDYRRKGFFKIPEGFLVKGLPCAAYDIQEQRWCRAIIVDAPEMLDTETQIEAFLVDYAISKKFTVNNLMCILKNHFNYPVRQLQSIII